jgi:hypothetical protein
MRMYEELDYAIRHGEGYTISLGTAYAYDGYGIVDKKDERVYVIRFCFISSLYIIHYYPDRPHHQERSMEVDHITLCDRCNEANAYRMVFGHDTPSDVFEALEARLNKKLIFA